PEAVPEPAPAPEPIAEAATEPTHAPRAEAEAAAPARSEAPQRSAAKVPESASAPQPAAPATRQRPPQDPDSVAAKLQRIRAVVGRQPSFAAEDEEENIAPAARPAAGMFDTAPKAETRRQPAEDTAAAKPAATEVRVEAKPAETAPKADAQEAPAPAHPPRARVVRMRKADFDRALARGEAHRMIETQTGATSGATASDPAEASSEPPYAVAHAGPKTAAEAEATAPDERDDPDAAIVETLSRQDETDMTEAAPAAPDAPTDAELSEEAERALLAELAALEREMGFEQDGPAQHEMKQEEDTRAEAEPPQAEAEAAQAGKTEEVEFRKTSDAAVEAKIGTEAETRAEAQPEARMPAEFEFVPPLPQQNESKEAQAPRDRRAEDGQPSKAPEEAQQNGQALGTDEADMSRILSATAARMDDPESGRRREAISQLKAAVAATEAARQLGEVEPREATEEVFRDDLRQAVRPRRPVLPTPEAEQPGEAQPRAERP
ncbi:hypothetical protein NHG85_16225, partial [Limimaricola sp. ASW11-118]|nr:hypothetical protein [Limimaricola litoreus]